MVPSGIKIGKEQLNILAYADDIVLVGENETETENFLQKQKTLPESQDYIQTKEKQNI